MPCSLSVNFVGDFVEMAGFSYVSTKTLDKVWDKVPFLEQALYGASSGGDGPGKSRVLKMNIFGTTFD